MEKENNQKKIQEIFEEIEEKAKELYPNINETIETFNSFKVNQESYQNYLNLINEQPLSKASNQTKIE